MTNSGERNYKESIWPGIILGLLPLSLLILGAITVMILLQENNVEYLPYKNFFLDERYESILQTLLPYLVDTKTAYINNGWDERWYVLLYSYAALHFFYLATLSAFIVSGLIWFFSPFYEITKDNAAKRAMAKGNLDARNRPRFVKFGFLLLLIPLICLHSYRTGRDVSQPGSFSAERYISRVHYNAYMAAFNLGVAQWFLIAAGVVFFIALVEGRAGHYREKFPQLLADNRVQSVKGESHDNSK